MQNDFNLHTLVMAGGKGTRFWPESTSKRPKQYLSLVTKKSLLSDTLTRFDGLVPKERRYIVTVAEQKELALKESQGQVDPEHLIFEPSGRNTGPCILLALAKLKRLGVSMNDVVAVVPSDHVILNQDGFRATVKEAALIAARERGIVTIGITPNFPHTGYGYIEKSEGIKVKSFREKPDLETARNYVASGKYLWNAGMFVAKLDVLLEEFKAHAPEMAKYFDELADAGEASIGEVYNKLPAESIDYAVMEKSQSVYVVPAGFDWNDLGSWDALESVVEKSAGNTVAQAKNVLALGSEGNIIFTPGKTVALVDVNDLVVIAGDDVVAVFPKNQAQRIKEIVELAKKKSLDSLL